MKRKLNESAKVKSDVIATSKFTSKQIIMLAIKIIIIATSVLYNVLGWEKIIYDINFYLDACIKSVFVVVIASMLQQIIAIIIYKLREGSPRSKTISALVKSLLKYAIAIVTIVIIMVNFLGSKYMGELFAGLGVVALVVGLGCQTLISDIVAGIFMVFEGNYQVGDVVVINGWRGTVIEIGLRTTVIEDIGGNKKIVNNSSISDIVNNSQALSFASCVVGIEYDESIERVENIISKYLDEIREKVPQIVEGPFYKGVEELAAASVNIKIVAKCKEEDKYQVQRNLNRELKLIFDKNNINIPFPQVTLSNRVIVEEVQKVSAKARQKAQDFLDEQTISSGDTDNQI